MICVSAGLLAAPEPAFADFLITSGTFVAASNSDLAGKGKITVDDIADAAATLQIDSGVNANANFIVLNNGGALDNRGLIQRAGVGNDGVYSETGLGSVLNQAGGTITVEDIGIYLGNGGAVTNTGNGTSVNGRIGIDLKGAGSTIANTDHAQINGDSGAGVYLGLGGQVTNSAGASIASNGAEGIIMFDAGSVINTDSSITGYTRGISIQGGTGTVTNTDGGTIEGTTDIGVYLDRGGTITNGAGSSIAGATAIYGNWDTYYTSADSITLTNSGTITGTSGTAIDLENGGSVTNQSAGTITGGGEGVLIWGGSVTNTGAGSAIIGNGGAGVDIADATTLVNELSAQIQGSSDGVRVFVDSTVTNRSGASITGADNGIAFYSGTSSLTNQSGATIVGQGITGAAFVGTSGTLINDGTGSRIEGAFRGVELGLGGTITNTNGASIIADSDIGVMMGGSGSVTNGTGSSISGQTGIYTYGAQTILNEGTIAGTAVNGIETNNDTVTITNQSGGAITGYGSGVAIDGAGTLLNTGAGSTITGTHDNGVKAVGAATLTNEAGAAIGGSTDGVEMDGGGTFLNQSGATVSGGSRGVQAWGADITNTGSTSRIDSDDTGVQTLAGGGSIANENGAAIHGAVNGILLDISSPLVNRTGATITGDSNSGVMSYDGGVIANSGTGSKIAGNAYGIYLQGGPGTLTNSDGATVSANGTGIAFLGGGTITNGIGSLISGGTSGISASGATILSNAGTISGNVELDGAAANQVTLYTGSKISGDLFIGSDADAALTLDGSGTELYSGIVTGTTTFGGTFTKQGSGDLLLDRNIAAFQTFVTEGQLVVESGGGLGTGDVTVDGAQLRIDQGGGLTSTIYAKNGATIINNGSIAVTVIGASGIESVTGIETIVNQFGGTIAANSDASSGGIAVALDNGGTFVNGAPTNADTSSVVGRIGVYSGSDATVSNTMGASIAGGAAAIYIAGNGEVTNSAGANIAGLGNEGVIIFGGGSVTNSGQGSIIMGHTDAVSISGGAGRVQNDSGAKISGATGTGVGLYDGGNIINTGDGSSIEGAYGVAIENASGIVSNGTGARIAGLDGAGVYLDHGGMITNQSGATISGTYYSIYVSGSATLENSGSIVGDVRLDDNYGNTVTLFTGSSIAGDLYINTSHQSALTLDGLGVQLYSQAATGVTTFKGELSKTAIGTWIIDKALTPNATGIYAGVLQIGNGGTAGSISGDIADYATLVFDRSNTLTYGGTISGNGVVKQQGAGTLILTGANSYEGGTIVGAGTLQIGNSHALGSGALSMLAGTALSFSGASDYALANAITISGDPVFNVAAGTQTLSGAISDGASPGTLEKAGNGTLILTGADTYTGGTLINAGTLQLGNGGTSGSISGSVADNGALAFDRSDNVMFSGAIAGSGSVMQMGGGTLTLAASNTYAGGSVVAAGTLSGSAASFGAGAILDNGTLVIAQSSDSAFANALNGSGSFIKRGAGKLALTGTSGLSGASTVAEGTLAVNGSLAQSTVTVQSGATLAGNGTVGSATLQSGGVIAPGNSIGVLHVDGAFVQQAGSVYQVEVDPGSAASDLVAVTGTATIGDGATLNVAKIAPGDYQIGTKYTVVTASGGISGNYTVTGDTAVSAFLALGEVQDANNVYLTLVKTEGFSGIATTPKQKAVAAALDSLPPENPLASALLSASSREAVRSVLGDLSGEIFASNQTMLIADSLLVHDVAIDRLRSATCGTPDDKPNDPFSCVVPDTVTFWTEALGDWGHIAARGDTARYSRSAGGFIVGMDIPVGSWRAGIFGGRSDTDFDVAARNSSGESGNSHLGIYGGTVWNEATLRLGASYTWSKLATDRVVAFETFSDALHSDYTSGALLLFGEVSRRFVVDDLAANAVSLEPFLDLSYVNVNTGTIAETGGDAALNGHPGAMDDVFVTLGLRPSAVVTLDNFDAKFSGTLGLRHTAGDTSPHATLSFAGSDPFAMDGAAIVRNQAVVGAEMEFDILPGATLDIGYTGQFANRFTDQGVHGRFTIHLGE